MFSKTVAASIVMSPPHRTRARNAPVTPKPLFVPRRVAIRKLLRRPAQRAWGRSLLDSIPRNAWSWALRFCVSHVRLLSGVIDGYLTGDRSRSVMEGRNIGRAEGCSPFGQTMVVPHNFQR